MVSLANIGSRLVSEAHKFIGDPYVFGAAGPKAFDCSGLVYYAARQLGITNIPRTSEEQWKWSEHISYKDLQPGDLIFMQFPGDQAAPGHVVIYAGNNRIIQAPQPGQDVQEISWKPSDMPSWGGKVIGYGRIPGSAGAGSAALDAGTAPALQATGGLSTVLNDIPGFNLIGQGISNITGTAKTIGDVGTGVQAIANDLGTLTHFFVALWRPSLWLRIGAFFGGIIAIGIGLWALAKALDIPTPSPSNMPMVVPV